MAKITMPEPVTAYAPHLGVGHIICGYTAPQMEAYAAAKVREALEAQTPYGYHIVSDVNGNGIAFCPADHPETITEFMQANPSTTIRAVALIPSP